MENIMIRRAILEDAPSIAKIHIETWQKAYKGRLPDSFLNSLSVENRTKRWVDMITNRKPNTNDLVAVVEDTVLGFCSIGPSRDKDANSKTGEIYAIYMDLRNARRGIGSKLLQQGFYELKKSGFNSVTLWVLSSNKEAQDFYERNGFYFDGTEKEELDQDIIFKERRFKKDFL